MKHQGLGNKGQQKGVMPHTIPIGRIALKITIALFNGVKLHAKVLQHATHLLFINFPDTKLSNLVDPDAAASVHSATGSYPALVFA